MIQKPYFTLSIIAVLIVQDTILTAYVVSSRMTTMNDHKKSVF